MVSIIASVFDNEMGILPDANVVEVGKTYGVTTDASGRFFIKVASPDSMLRISYVGFEPQIIRAGDVPQYVELQPDVTQLDEVVITSHGHKKTDYTLLWVGIALTAGVVISKMLGQKPRTVKV